jgi:hypothetical protein
MPDERCPTVRAEKAFHIFVGFWFAGNLYLFVYLGGSAIYALATNMPCSGTSLFSAFPRFAMIASSPVPLAIGIAIWPARKYVSTGMVLFGTLAFVYWLGKARLA